ncbi:glucose 1-dehydrogenase [Phytoactinopolyspora limicola]|uniref:glucose 1-dehydrogenase n=1 Tax=Phytoactinopolyspora limicola TaxID=2715536 RepID=UPI00140A5F55
MHENTPGSSAGRFDGRVVLVTGGGSGIGRGVARAFAREGGTVVVSGRRQDALEETTRLVVDEDGGQAIAITCDVTTTDGPAELVEKVLDHFGRLDVAVNNAGVLVPGPVAEMSDDDWASIFDVNVTGVFRAMKHQIIAMRKQGGGAIVNIGSNIGAHSRLPGMAAYAASKAAVGALSRTAALEHIRDGIRINVVSPGPVDAPMSLLPGETPTDRAARFKDLVPIGRVGDVDEIASAVMWLASAESGFTVGHDLVIDGGATA